MTPENITLSDKQTRDRCRFISVPLCRQETEYTCGVACVQSILGAYGMDYRQDELAQILDSKPILGTNYQKIILFMEMLGFQAVYIKNMGIDNLKSFINDGVTPLLQIQAWAENGVDYASDWKDSHYVIACGYDENRIFFMDPWTLGNYTYLSGEELLERWHVPDLHFGQCYGGGLIITKEHCAPLYDPSVVKYLG
ncbi:cysteine peptidase family C39 domain-containing protein [Sporomusa acidovorans]|nr:cysteine peptidase family C39 domain-containing protein [Sporomusa acidovorans]